MSLVVAPRVIDQSYVLVPPAGLELATYDRDGRRLMSCFEHYTERILSASILS